MKCADPKLRLIKNGNISWKHFSLASHFEKYYVPHVPFNCRKCIFCRKKASLELARRCVLHAACHTHNSFITLTYNEDSIGDNQLQYKDIQDFKKRLRQYVKRKYDRKIQVFNVHEYGKNGRKHWHLVVFGHDFEDRKEIPHDKGTLYSSKTLAKLWKHGFNSVGDVTEASAMYQAQYTQKDIKNGNTNNFKKTKSTHSGIGKPYFYKHHKQILTNGYISFGNQKMPVPDYFLRLAHKHYCYYYEPNAFQKTLYRERLYTPFRQSSPDPEIANLYRYYKLLKQDHINKIEEEWENTIQQEYLTGNKPDFVHAAENYMHELKKKQLITEKF